MNKRTQYPPEFKTKVVLEILTDEQTVNQIAAKYSVPPLVISRWKKEFLEWAPEIFKKGPSVSEKALWAADRSPDLMTSIPPSERICEAISEFLTKGISDSNAVANTLFLLGAQSLIHKLLDQKATDYLGRERIERSEE